ncbi:conserved hypothetical protein [Mesorhizobium ventifaucium]|uniref:Secreted protein n=1 Tax=Mesorhizobium ventifaucium TaxID=666020 RepID=A0ABM9DTC9_9HYPH|nr:conserved hypothetical protein [Mesorhizobium ventifaucium]
MQLRNKLSDSFAFLLLWLAKHLFSVAGPKESIRYKRQLRQIIIIRGLRCPQDQHCLRNSARI